MNKVYVYLSHLNMVKKNYVNVQFFQLFYKKTAHLYFIVLMQHYILYLTIIMSYDNFNYHTNDVFNKGYIDMVPCPRKQIINRHLGIIRLL